MRLVNIFKSSFSLAAIITVALFILACGGGGGGGGGSKSAPTDIWDGTIGTLEPTTPGGSIYEIHSAAQFAALADPSFSFSSEQAFQLKANLNLDDHPWTPINNFKGTFNGNGLKITGLKLPAGVSHTGLFGRITGDSLSSPAVVKNLTIELSDDDSGVIPIDPIVNYAGVLAGEVSNTTLEHISVNGEKLQVTSSNTSALILGGIVGYLNNSSISHSSATIDVIGESTASYAYVGGIIGNSYSSITDCHSTGKVTSIVSTTTPNCAAYAGGIAGNADQEITSCSSSGDITATSSSGDAYAGGITGIGSNTFDDCHTTGEIKANASVEYAYAGGITGRGSSKAFTNCSSIGDITAKVTNQSKGASAGGMTGDGGNAFTNCSSSGDITAEAADITSYAYAGGVAGNGGEVSFTSCSSTGVISADASGTGGSALAAGIIGGSGIVSFSSCFSTGTITANGAYYAYAGGLLGNSSYYITIKENSYASGKITAIATDASSDAYAGGLSAFNNGHALISDSHATGAVSAKSKSGAYAGGIAGRINSSIQPFSKSYATGSVEADSNTAYAGGLIGQIGAGDTLLYSELYSTGNVTANSISSAYAGGLIGETPNNAISISKSYSTGAIKASSNLDSAHAGGLLGKANVSINESYSLGSVTAEASGPAYAGGITGQSSNATITCCYSHGAITADTPSPSTAAYVGGIIGSTQNGSISYCYSSGDIGALAMNQAYAGGIIGNNYSTSISNSYTSGKIEAYDSTDSHAGGIVGYITAYEPITIGTCANISREITAAGADHVSAGRIVGHINGSNVNFASCSVLNETTIDPSTPIGIGNPYQGGIPSSWTHTSLTVQLFNGSLLGWAPTDKWKFTSSEHPKLKWQTN